MRNFRELDIWKKAIAFSKSIYELSGSLPEKEKYGLIIQIQRASVSIPSNIAEGSSRSSQADFSRYLEIALGSAFEVETQLTIAKEICYITTEQLIKQLEELTILQKQINQLITVIRKRK